MLERPPQQQQQQPLQGHHPRAGVQVQRRVRKDQIAGSQDHGGFGCRGPFQCTLSRRDGRPRDGVPPGACTDAGQDAEHDLHLVAGRLLLAACMSAEASPPARVGHSLNSRRKKRKMMWSTAYYPLTQIKKERKEKGKKSEEEEKEKAAKFRINLTRKLLHIMYREEEALRNLIKLSSVILRSEPSLLRWHRSETRSRRQSGTRPFRRLVHSSPVAWQERQETCNNNNGYVNG